MLALLGPAYAFDFAAGELQLASHPLRIEFEGGQGRGTGWSVWDGAVSLASYLEHHLPIAKRRHDQQQEESAAAAAAPFRIVELGAGTGLAGIAAAAAYGEGCEVTLTDLPEVLQAN